MNHSINIGFIGCGKWAQEIYLPYLSSNKSVSLVSLSGVIKKNEKNILQLKKLFKRYYNSWQDMLRDEKLDLVIISTPHAFHYFQIKQCLENKVNVHVDKPPALKHKEMMNLISLAKKNNVFVNIHVQKRHYPEYKLAKRLINQGKMGKIEFISGMIGQQLFDDFIGSWRASPKLAGGGIMMDIGYHMLDIIIDFLWPTDVKNIQMMSNWGDHKADRYSTLTFKLSNDCVVNLSVIRGLPKNYSLETLNVVGTHGFIKLHIEKSIKEKISILDYYNVNGIKKNTILYKTSTEKALPLIESLRKIRQRNYSSEILHKSALTVKILEAGYASMKIIDK